MKHTVTLIPGDGVGPELSEAMVRCVEATGVNIQWDTVNAGEAVMEKEGTPLPESVLDSIRKNKVAIKGPITTPVGKGFRSVNVALRKALNLYACVRPCKFIKSTKRRLDNIDMVLVRENSEDLYAGIEYFEKTPECDKMIALIKQLSGEKSVHDPSAISIKPISSMGSARIAKYAFEYALKHGRKQVTAVHKANIMKATDGLFLRTVEEVSKAYQGKVEFNERIVDNMCMQLVQRPGEYDVLVLPNLYGDIVSDLCAGLIGGLGVAPGANIGDEYAVFEATHGSAPNYKGQNRMNPSAMILSAVMMLDHMNESAAARKLENGIHSIISEGKDVTYDLKPDKQNAKDYVGTKEMADAIIKRMRSL